MRRSVTAAAFIAVLAGLAAAGDARSAEPATEPRVVACSECGMDAEVAGRFTARLVAGGVTRHFCDIGDLVAFIARTGPRDYAAAVRDFPSGEWLAAGTARFVIDKKTYATPMGWGVAAFRDGAAAAGPTLDFEALRQALR